MNKHIKTISIFLLLVQLQCFAPGFLEFFAPKEQGVTKKLITSTLQERKDLLEKLSGDLKKLQDSSKEFSEQMQGSIDNINSQIEEIKEKTAIEKESEEIDFNNKRLSILNEIYQSLFNMQLSHKEIITLLEQHLKLLEEYFKDPDFSHIAIKPQSFYTYKELQEQNKKIITQEDRIAHLQEQKNEAQVELENLTKKLNSIKKDYLEKKKEQESFATEKTPITKQDEGLDYRKQGIIIDLEEQFLQHEKELTELKLEQISRKISFINTTISLENEKLRILKNDLSKIRTALKIDQKDIQDAQEALAESKKKSIANRDAYYQDIKAATAQKSTLTKELEFLKKKYASIDISQENLRDWSISPKNPQEYIALCELGSKNEHIELLDSYIEHVREKIDLEKAQTKYQEISFEILNTWFKISRRKFRDQDEIVQEFKHYQALLSEKKREEVVIKDKRNTATNLLNIKNKVLTNLKLFINDFKTQWEKFLTKIPLIQLNGCLRNFMKDDEAIENQIKNINSLIKTYNTHIGVLNSTIQDLSGITAELETKSIWQRSEYAISWQGIKNIPTDLRNFFYAFTSLAANFFANFSLSIIVKKIKDPFATPYEGLLLFFRLFLIVGLYLFLRYYLKLVAEYLLAYHPAARIWLVTNRLCASILLFVWKHLFSIYLWILFFAAISADLITDLFVQVTFYLISIIYFSYLTYQFVKHDIIEFNKKYNYEIFNQAFQHRLIFVFSFFAYLSIVLLLFRESFMIVTYHTSELPTILLATYSIIIRILIIFSIGKDEILSLIPSKRAGWSAIAHFIDRYYWPLLALIILIMIMSDPYVGGYGNLVSYAVWGVIGTLILIKALLLCQGYIRKYASHIFFIQEDDTLKERFAHSRSFFGLFVIALFLILVTIGLLLGLRIWGQRISWVDITNVLHYQIIKGEEFVTPLTLLGVIGFVIAGFIIAFAVNRFVVKRIFQLLPVDVGVQNTITSLIRYVVIFTAVFLGFYWGNLSSYLVAIGIIIGSIGYIVKEPIADFISYFIILVQRPIKIGDYIETSEQTMGIVRQITPRSVILRSKNSFSVIVPNSEIIKAPIRNWNYAGVFVALDDIFFSVPYSVDPSKVRTIIAQVLDRSPHILKTPKFIIRLHEFGENGYVFMVRGFITSNKTLDKWDIASDVRFELVKALQINKIPMTLPTRVWVRSIPMQEPESEY